MNTQIIATFTSLQSDHYNRCTYLEHKSLEHTGFQGIFWLGTPLLNRHTYCKYSLLVNPLDAQVGLGLIARTPEGNARQDIEVS